MSNEQSLEQLLTTSDIARRLGVSLPIARKVRANFRAVRIGRWLRYPESELQAFIRRGGCRPELIDFRAVCRGRPWLNLNFKRRYRYVL